MNSRERFVRTMRYENPDRPVFCEFLGFWGETINRWYGEGLPLFVSTRETPLPIGAGEKVTIFEYFGFDKIGGPLRAEICAGEIPLDFGPIPRFPPETMEEDDRYRVVLDEIGIRKKVLKIGDSIPTFIDFPVKDENDWEQLKERFSSKDVRRYPKNWSSETKKYYAEADYPVGVGFPGFFGQARNLMGTHRLLPAFYKSSKLVHDIMDFWAEFVIETIAEAVESVPVDYANVWEDMSYNAGPLISPRLFQEFMLPCYKSITGYLRKKGVDTIMVDTDGNHEALNSLFLEGGVNCLYPLEAQAGMDAADLRKRYGRNLRLIGNIDKKALHEGKRAIEGTLMSKASLLNEGGYIASVDHVVPPDVPLENYVYYLSLLKKQLGTKCDD